jgi:hypothetical protein
MMPIGSYQTGGNMARLRYLTKSRFKLARECSTKLFYSNKKDQYDDQSLDDPFLRALAYGGFQVGELAKIYHPGGHMIDSLSYDKALNQTIELLTQENVTIYEAALLHENCFVRVDVLVKYGDRIDLIEVKSKSFDPKEDNPFYDRIAVKQGETKIKSSWLPYLEDIAFQTHVAKGAFPTYRVKPFLMLADKSAKTSVAGLNQRFLVKQSDKGRMEVVVKEGTDESVVGDKILCTVPVAEEVNKIINSSNLGTGRSFSQEVKHLADAYENDTKLTNGIGLHCKSCQFSSGNLERSGFHECWSSNLNLSVDELNPPKVFDVWNFRKANTLLAKNIFFMKDITRKDVGVRKGKNPGLSTTERQWLQIDSCSSGKTDFYVDKDSLGDEMKSWTFPLHFIDFETTMVAIPFNKGKRPYEQTAW